VSAVLDDGSLVHRIAGRGPWKRYGVGFDERVVEYPWLLAQPFGGLVLDAGSVLNHEHILDCVLPRTDHLTIATLTPEALSFPERGVSYVYCDLRSLPFRDDWFDTVVCLSTLEHVGMDNSVYGASTTRATDPASEAQHAVRELRRVTKPDGRILLSLPYGRSEDHGWFRQFDASDVEAVTNALRHPEVTVFLYSPGGWKRSSLKEASEARYHDATVNDDLAPDRAAAARAVVCISASC
jgi:SAM-dependent methyltransferase